MSLAWETTVDDVRNVLTVHDIVVSDERLDEIHGSLDFDAIERNLLHYDDIDVQTNSMMDDIERQLSEAGIIRADRIWSPGNPSDRQADLHSDCG